MSMDFDRRAFLKAGVSLSVLATASGMLAGCGNDQPGTDAPADTGKAKAELPTYQRYTGVTPDLAGNDQGVMDGYLKYPADPPKLFDAPPGDGKPVTAMTPSSSPVPPGMDRNAYWQELNKQLGSQMQVAVSPSGDYPDKFATTLASDSLPDLFNVQRDTPQQPQMLKAKAVDLTEYLAGDAVLKYPNLANIPTASWRAAIFEGRIYGVPIPRGVLSSSVILKRKDLLQAKGITDDPKSAEEFYDLFKELTNPQDNVWAITTPPTNFLRQALKIPNEWEHKDGTLVSFYEHPAQKDMLEMCRKMFSEGLISPDSYSATSQTRKTWFGGGKAYFMADTLSSWTQFYQQYSGGNPDFALEEMKIFSFDGNGSGAMWLGNPTHSISAISKKSQDRVETLLNVLNWFASPFGTQEYLFRLYGIEGVDHTTKDGDPVLTTKGASEIALGTNYLADAPWPIYQPGNVESTKAQYQAQVQEIPTAVANPVVGLYSETNGSKGGTLDGNMEDLEADIIQDRQPVSAWDEGVKKWKRDGGDKIRDELLAALNAS